MPFVDVLDRPFTGAKIRTWRIFGFLRLSRGEFEGACGHFEQLSKSANPIGALYWHALSTHCGWRAKDEDHEGALRLVRLLHDPILAKRVERDTRDYGHLTEARFPQMNCDDCDRCELGSAGCCLGSATRRPMPR